MVYCYPILRWRTNLDFPSQEIGLCSVPFKMILLTSTLHHNCMFPPYIPSLSMIITIPDIVEQKDICFTNMKSMHLRKNDLWLLFGNIYWFGLRYSLASIRQILNSFPMPPWDILYLLLQKNFLRRKTFKNRVYINQSPFLRRNVLWRNCHFIRFLNRSFFWHSCMLNLVGWGMHARLNIGDVALDVSYLCLSFWKFI